MEEKTLPPTETNIQRIIRLWKASREESRKESEEFMKTEKYQELKKRLSEKNKEMGPNSRTYYFEKIKY